MCRCREAKADGAAVDEGPIQEGKGSCHAMQAHGEDVASRSVQKEVAWHGHYGGVMKGEAQSHDSEQVLLCVAMNAVCASVLCYVNFRRIHHTSLHTSIGRRSNRTLEAIQGCVWCSGYSTNDLRMSGSLDDV